MTHCLELCTLEERIVLHLARKAKKKVFLVIIFQHFSFLAKIKKARNLILFLQWEDKSWQASTGKIFLS